MSKVLEHAYLGMDEKARVEKLCNSFRNHSIQANFLKRSLLGMGFERGSVERYVNLLQSTIEDMQPDYAPAARSHLAMPEWYRNRLPRHLWW